MKLRRNSFQRLCQYFVSGLLCLALGASFSLVSAQTMNLALDGEVRLDAGDLDGRSYFPKYDQNDELCALIKVTVTNKLKNPLSLETGAAGVMERQERENGEIWFWVPYQVKNLKFSCFEYTPLPTIPVKLERGKVYRLTLRSDAQVQTFTNVSATFNFLKLQILPADAGNAFVSIGKTSAYELDAQYAVDGMYSSPIPLDYGEYYYRIEHELYETLTGKVVLDQENSLHQLTLAPAYGYLSVISEPSGATVAIDGKRVGTTPWQSSDKMPKGPVSIRLQMTNYALDEQTYTIQGDGQVQTHHVRLTPQFGTVTCRSEMSDAEIWVDQQQVGVGSWTGPLSSQGTHILEARKAGHQSQSISFTVASGETKTQTVGTPIPMYGTLILNAVPAGSEVWIDGEQRGVSPLVEQLLVGKHEIILKKSGYEDEAFDVEIRHNQRRDEKRTMKQAVVAGAASGSTRGGDKGSDAQGATLTADYGMEFVFVEGGTLQMGATSEQGADAESTEKPVHSVTLSDYYIGKYEVTQAQWKSVMGSNPSSFRGDNLPVENVSWEDIQEFIVKLNQKTGKTYRLPTEAEWENAARGGNKSQGYKYAGSNEIGEVAWYGGNSGKKTHPVGQKQPNELGLYDMSGNVYEWCQDWYGAYSSGSRTNPTGPASGSYRVLRGGSWYNSARLCRVSDRNFINPSYRDHFSGFRLVLGELPPPEEPEEDPLEALEKSMVFVEGGTFQMGATSEQGLDADVDEKPVHSVILSDYYIGKYEVTQAQWEAVMGSNPRNQQGDDFPVEMVSWDDVQEFIVKLNQKTGKSYRLPTEAEWEYAARGGNKSKGYKYAGSNKIDEVAWCEENSGNKTHPVGQKQPNELGLYDMSGNVYEWCQDWYWAYSGGSQTNPSGPANGSCRVLRGGSWETYARYCRVSSRLYNYPSSGYFNSGFRLVLGELPPPEEPEEDPLEALEKSMVFVEGVTFQMGATKEQGSDADDDEKPVHSVTLSDYYIGKYEVTQAQWEAVMGSNPSYFRGDNLPVEQVSWEDVQEFIAKLNEKTGKTYRLPTEAEWEYAARGGNKSKGYKYAGSNEIDEVAWYNGNSSNETHPVGQKQPNELGLYDMSGNVYEWCQDWYGTYRRRSQTNPTGPDSGSFRVLRGGGWHYGARSCRVSFRYSDYPSRSSSIFGFRLVLVP